ncbi:MAG: hypothetical protein HC921_06710 [Synechococcaceae cyanobacterium SM2_3_1]|nr:hypothetical protein [Synechococcaceae cyanobacterium SM2_3_1]
MTVASEHSWQRLSRYTETGEPAVRDRIRLQVTHKFVADSFMRLVQHDYGCTLFKALRPSGITAAPHEYISPKSRSWTMFDVAKLTHPAVQVLPGEPMSKWRQVISSWIDHISDYLGLKEGFETDYAECYIHAPRDIWNEKLDAKFKKKMEEYLGDLDDSTLIFSHDEFFDRLTAYIDIIMPGVAKTDYMSYFHSRDDYDNLSWNEKLLTHSWLLELGVMMSEPAIRFEGMAGECLWGCACWVVVPYDQIRGEGPVPANRKQILKEGIQAMTRTVVATP